MTEPVTPAQMKGYLTRHKAIARCTATQELWYHRTWQLGLPLGLAYLEMIMVTKRNGVRMKEIAALRRRGFTFDKDRRGWFNDAHEPGAVFTRKQALAIIADKTGEAV